MQWLKKSLEVLTVVSFGAAALGTIGACDLGTIGLGQALLQIGICNKERAAVPLIGSTAFFVLF